jgi:hypothetical protein
MRDYSRLYWQYLGGRYGLTPERAKEIRERSACVCEACGEAKKLHWDHDHETREVRGLLCHGCNVALGMVGDGREGTVDNLKAVIRYVEEWNARPRDVQTALAPSEDPADIFGY